MTGTLHPNIRLVVLSVESTGEDDIKIMRTGALHNQEYI